MKKLFSFIFAACMAVTAFAAEEVSTCPAGTLADGKVTHELECCTIVQEQGESTTALKSVSPWQAPAKSIMTITPKAGVSIEQFSVNTKNTTLATYLGKAELTNATKTSTKNTIVTFAVTDPTQPVVMKFVSTTIKFAELTITYTASAVTPDPEQPADTTVTPTPEPEDPVTPKPTGEIYTVAGAPANLFGTEWDPANKANIMEFLEDGTYKWEKKDVEMSATTVQFKVVKGSAWGTEYPSSNYNLKIAKSGKYIITITFDPATTTVNATATLQQEVDILPSIAIAGDMNGWSTTANTFTMAEDKKTASLALNLEAKDYGFKMIIGGSWTNDGQKITRENNSGVYTGANVDANGTLSADVAGEYTFTWTYATSTLVVTYPALTPDPEQPGDTTVTPEPEPTVVYTVAGEPAALFGTEWDAANASNAMTAQADGTYKWEKADVELTARDIEFKVVKDGNWSTSFPAENVKYTIAQAGKYDVTITFDPAKGTPEINAVLDGEPVTPEPEDPVTPKPTGEIYTVAGAPANLFGTEWDPSNKANIMEFLEDGTYKWEKKDVEMSATTVQFKVVKGSAWGTEYPSSNYELKIAKSGKYIITITFDPATTTVNATATLQQEVEIIPSIAIAGDMNGWSTSANTFTMAEDKKTASLALNLEAKDYGFKMIIAGSWTNDGQVITRENNSAVYTGANVDTNGTLTADVAGEYIFTWTYETSTLVVTYPAQDATGFEEIEAAENPVKFIENGKLYIIREGNIYDATGARVK